MFADTHLEEPEKSGSSFYVKMAPNFAGAIRQELFSLLNP